jgi:peptidoglycan-associated lipoprotein
MTRIQHGRGGWLLSEERLAGILVAAFVLGALIALPGCASKKAQAIPGEGGGAGLGEGGMGGKGSLQQFQQGTLGQGGEGPLHDIHFDYDDYTIRQQDSEILRVNAKWLQDHPKSHVQVEGHCDERGSAEYNMALGAKRAQAAKDYLNTLGVAADRVTTISYGKELPLCTEHDEECWSRNRRGHFVVSGGGA